jgi:hypothetical protein
MDHQFICFCEIYHKVLIGAPEIGKVVDTNGEAVRKIRPSRG